VRFNLECNMKQPSLKESAILRMGRLAQYMDITI
jgi:hypothetical protein